MADEVLNLSFTERGKRGCASRGEYFQGGESPEVAPVGTVGGGAEVCVVVGEVFDSDHRRSVSKSDVILGEAFFSRRGGGD